MARYTTTDTDDTPTDWSRLHTNETEPQAASSVRAPRTPLGTPKRGDGAHEPEEERGEESGVGTASVGTNGSKDAMLFIKGIIDTAISNGASDIHLEPRSSEYRVRLRIDGNLQDFVKRPRDEYEKILNTIKVLADMDIAVHQVPQDGHIELFTDAAGSNRDAVQGAGWSKEETQHMFDLRASTFPSVNGEVIVLRVLNRSSALVPLDELGMDIDALQKLRLALRSAFGMFLITGPTGSGKTTTLYSILRELKNDEKNIVSLEDPVEFHLDWMRQAEIHEERNFTFERAMESILRQDPDILMVGEIRDPKTAEYAVRSALVGRIVGSTIHANTTIGTIARLLELGIPRSLLAHAVNGIIAQRLVRKTCTACKEEYVPASILLNHFELSGQGHTFYRGRGCDVCKGTGYKGRVGLFSVLIMDDEVRSMIFDQRSLEEIQARAVQNGMKTLKMDAVSKVLAGVTTLDEAAKTI